eukprot:1371095-Prymnesium_polylepis.1
MREPSGEPVATFVRPLGCSRLHTGAQRRARPTFAASSPSSRTAPTVNRHNGRAAQTSSESVKRMETG